MADSRFFTYGSPFALGVIAKATGSVLQKGNSDFLIKDVAPLSTASISDLSFIDNTKYLAEFSTSNAAACFVNEKFASRAPDKMALLVTEEPYTAFAIASGMFYPEAIPQTEIHETAAVAKTAKLGANVKIGANSYIGENVEIGENSSIGANSTITHAIIGKNVIIHRGVHIGQDGFGFAPSKKGIVKVPQLGRVLIEENVEIGSGTCIDRGSGPDTVIGANSKIDNLVQIGHNVKIGRYVLIAGQAGIAGSAVIGDGAMIGGQVGIAGHIKIGKGVKIAAQSGVMSDIEEGETHMGSPSMPIKECFRQHVIVKKLSERKN